MNRRDLLGAVLPGAIVGGTAVTMLMVTGDAPAADPWVPLTASRALTPAEFRDELERCAAEKIVEIERMEADPALSVQARHDYARLFRFEANGLFIALRLLGGYGWTNFDSTWARDVLATKGAPRSAGLSWPELPGGPVAGERVVLADSLKV